MHHNLKSLFSSLLDKVRNTPEKSQISEAFPVEAYVVKEHTNSKVFISYLYNLMQQPDGGSPILQAPSGGFHSFYQEFCPKITRQASEEICETYKPKKTDASGVCLHTLDALFDKFLIE